MRQELIEQVKSGAAWIHYGQGEHGTLTQLRKILKACFPNDKISRIGLGNYYFKFSLDENSNWALCNTNPDNKPTIKLSQFFEPMTRQEEISQLEARLAELRKGTAWEDLGTVSGWYVASISQVKEVEGANAIGLHRNIYATKEQAEAFGIAAPQLTQLVKDMRGGWEPDWYDGSTNKYVPSINKEGIFIEVFTWSAHPFALPTRELCLYFINLHSELLLTYFNGTTT